MDFKYFAKIVIGMGAVAMMLAGCSDDGSATLSSPSSSENSSNENPDPITNPEHGSNTEHSDVNIPGIVISSERVISVDENAGIFVTGHEYNCTRNNSNSPIRWDSPARKAVTDSVLYTVSNDTLYVLVNDKEDYREYEIFVGNNSGSILGSWKITYCVQKTSGEIICDNDDEVEIYKDRYLTFTKDSLYESYTVNEEFNYMSTYFMYGLYGTLRGEDFHDEYARASEIAYYYSEMGSELSGIEIVETNKTSQTFKYEGQSFDVKVKKTHYKSNYEVEVSSNGKTCSSYYRNSNVTKDLCKEEYSDYLRFDDSYKDGEEEVGSEFEFAYRYKESNNDEFVKCLKSLVPQGTDN